MLNYLGLPAQAATHAGEIDQMISLVHWLMLVLFVGWGAYFLYVLVRFRKRANPKASYEGAKGKLSKGLEIGVVVVEMVLLVFYAIPAWAKRVKAFPSESEAVVVRIVAEQFAWNIHYPGDDGEFGETSAALISGTNPLGLDRASVHGQDDVVVVNQLHLPTGRPVVMQLSSKDVIHSFGVPAMRVKQDAIPGVLAPVWFTPTISGQYEIACSQLCGLAHFRMRGIVTVESLEAFQAFLVSER